MMQYNAHSVVTVTTASGAASDTLDGRVVPERLRSVSPLEPGQSVVPPAFRTTSEPETVEDEQIQEPTAE
jgi:hypothetical protein